MIDDLYMYICVIKTPLKRNMKNLWHSLWEKLACMSKDVCKINIPDHVYGG